MGKQLAIEFRRLLKSPTFYLAIAIGLFIAIHQIVEVTLPIVKVNDNLLKEDELVRSVFMYMMGMMSGIMTWHYDMLKNLMPILVALPFGASFYMDRKTGYIKNLFVREKKINYLGAKYIVTFVSGGVVASLPTFVNFIGTMMFLPLIEPLAGTRLFAQVPDYMQYLYYEMPVMYILCICLIQFLIGGLLATTCLGASYLVDIVFLAQLFPVIFVYLYNMLMTTVFETWTFDYYYDVIIYKEVSLLNFATVIAIMAIFSGIYFYNGMKEETL